MEKKTPLKWLILCKLGFHHVIIFYGRIDKSDICIRCHKKLAVQRYMKGESC